MKGEIQEFDYVVLNPQWFCHDVLGVLFSAEFIQRCRVTGCYGADDFHPLFADVPDIMDLMQVLDALSVCAQYETDGDLEYEFAALNYLDPPKFVWEKEANNYVYGGVRLTPPRGMDHMMGSIFSRQEIFDCFYNLQAKIFCAIGFKFICDDQCKSSKIRSTPI